VTAQSPGQATYDCRAVQLLSVTEQKILILSPRGIQIIWFFHNCKSIKSLNSSSVNWGVQYRGFFGTAAQKGISIKAWRQKVRTAIGIELLT
jgi:hypothetical protein